MYQEMSEEAEIVDNSSTSHPDHRISPWPEHIKILMKGMWLNSMPPSKIAETINGMGVLGKPVHANTISQYFSAEKRKDPSILVEREKTKQELVEAATTAVSEMRDTILGKIKESTLLVFNEATDKLPKSIRHTLQLLDEHEGDPRALREITITLKMQIDILSKLSGADIMQRVQEYRGKKLVDVEFHGQFDDPDGAPKNVTPAVVEIEGWVHR